MEPRKRNEGAASQMDDGPQVEDIVVKMYRNAAVVKGGRRFSFSAMVVVGDRNGHVGIGYGKSRDVPAAVEKAKKIATEAMVGIQLVGGTLPHRLIGRFGSSHVVMIPASPGTGVIAWASVRAVLELAGVRDVLTKSYGSNSPKNVVRAVFNGLTSLLTREKVEALRGVKLAG